MNSFEGGYKQASIWNTKEVLQFRCSSKSHHWLSFGSWLLFSWKDALKIYTVNQAVSVKSRVEYQTFSNRGHKNVCSIEK